MESNGSSAFRRAALASGLVTARELQEAEAMVRGAGSIPPADDVADEQLAAMLVGMGRLNQWQAEQLKAGRAKFNLGPYRILDSLGQGGMGQVFKAVHTLLGRVVAVKVLPQSKSTPETIESFNREMRTHGQLEHDHLVRAFDAGQDGNVYYLVTEYVPGTDLRKLVRRRGPLSMHEAAAVISQAAKGLAHAHRQGLVHRDVKPGNLLVSPGGLCKVSDVGLAGFLGPVADDDPRAGKTVGTADYLSPEHILTPREMQPASDVYSLGCTLYYAVTGKVPFPGGNARSKARRHCQDAPITPRRFNAELSGEFLDVLAAMMEKDPRQRIQSADEVVRRLAPWAETRPTGPAREGKALPLAARAQGAVDGGPGESPSEPFDAVFEPADESVSQISQGTDPIVSQAQDTWNDSQRFLLRARDVQVPVQIAALALAPLALAAAVLLAALLIKALS